MSCKLIATGVRRNVFSTLLFLIVTSYCIEARSAGAPVWWSIIELLQVPSHNQSLAMSPREGVLNTGSILCNRIPGLASKQLHYCRRQREFMPSIAKGVKEGIDQCKNQFKINRWDCNTLPLRRQRLNRRRSIFGPILEIASSEAAFVHAIAAAGIAHAVTRACTKSSLKSCGCDVRKRVRNNNWRWGGCNEDVEFGIKVSRDFADAHNQGSDARAIMNRHNNEAGRQALRDKMRLQCKCHGLSGSCEVQTCWWGLPNFNEVGKRLKRLYHDASQMEVKGHVEARGWVSELVPKHHLLPPPEAQNLIYFDKSPNYCDKNRTLGIEGTRGRICKAGSSKMDGCDLLCCGRGSVAKKKVRLESCKCLFHWCCDVTCETCEIKYVEHTCR